MTTQVETETELSEEQKILVGRAASEIAAGKLKLADVWAALVSPAQNQTQPAERKPPSPLVLTEDQEEALVLLPEVYGIVAPTENRLLSEGEAKTLVRERKIIDTVLSFLTKRKDESIREALANHTDHVFLQDQERQGLGIEGVPVDAKGHFQVKTEIPVKGTQLKIQKTISEPKPVLSAAAVLKAHEDGILDRKTFLKITRVPDVPRELDEDGLAKAIKADPSLLLTLSRCTTTANKTTTIKVVPNT